MVAKQLLELFKKLTVVCQIGIKKRLILCGFV